MTIPMRIEVVRRSSDPPDVGRAAASRAFVSAQRARARAEASATLQTAAETASRHIERARAEAEALRDAARVEGHVDGERAWARAALELAESRARLLGNLERDCVTLALEIARQIVGTAVAVDRGLVDAIAERVCVPLKRDGVLTVRVSRDDVDRIDPIRERLAQAGPVTIEIDPTLSSGECVAECAGVRVDGRLDVQLAAFEPRLPERPSSGGRQ